MSPGQTLRSSRSMFRSTRAVPVRPGREVLRESSPDIFMGAILSAKHGGSGEARRNIRPRSYLASHL